MDILNLKFKAEVRDLLYIAKMHFRLIEKRAYLSGSIILSRVTETQKQTHLLTSCHHGNAGALYRTQLIEIVLYSTVTKDPTWPDPAWLVQLNMKPKLSCYCCYLQKRTLGEHNQHGKRFAVTFPLTQHMAHISSGINEGSHLKLPKEGNTGKMECTTRERKVMRVMFA